VADYMLAPHQMLCVSGSIPQLGAWQPDLLLPLTEVEGLWWEGEVRVPFAHFPFTFKYAVKDLPAAPPHRPGAGGLSTAIAAMALHSNG
ncbi:cytosolic 4-alpha-glucanotransferase, partial [Haematococcus lacustris]